MTGIRKTAIFLLTLKGKISGEIFKRLSEPDQEKVLVEIASPATISPDERAVVMDDFLGIMQSEGIYASGGLEEAEALLEQAFGSKQIGCKLSLNKLLSACSMSRKEKRSIVFYRQKIRKRLPWCYPTCLLKKQLKF